MPKFYKQLQQFCSNIAFYLDFQYKKIKIIWYTELPNKLLCILNHFDDYKHIYKYNFFGLCFLILLFYNRLLIEKLPKNLELFYILLLITSIVMIISQSYVIYKTIKALFYAENKKNKSYLTRWIIINSKKKQKKYIHKDDILKIKTFIYDWNLPKRIKNTYGILLSILVHLNFVLKVYYKISLLIVSWLKTKTFAVYILLFIFPKVLMCLIFFIEVIFLNQIIYFYKFLWVLIIPLITKIILYTLEILSEFRLNTLSQAITYTIVNETDNDFKEEELGYSQDEKKYFKFAWADPKYYSLSEKVLINTMFEILNNRQIMFFVEDLYKIENLRHIQIFSLLLTGITVSVWLYIFIQMAISFFN